MRSLILAIAVALLLLSKATAQERATVGGLWLGMSLEEARAAAPRMSCPRDELTFSAPHRRHRIEGLSTPLHVIFVAGRLDFIGGSDMSDVDTAQACNARLLRVIEALEPSVGPFDDAEDNSIFAGAQPPIQTAGGSIVRINQRNGGGAATAIQHAPVFAEARAWFNSPGAPARCVVQFDLSAQQPPSDLPIPTLRNVPWVARATPDDYSRHYPQRAMDLRRPGVGILSCTIRRNGTLDCGVSYEGPEGWGFDDAALRISRSFRVAPDDYSGNSTELQTVRLVVQFRPSE